MTTSSTRLRTPANSRAQPDVLAIVGSHEGLDIDDLAEARSLIEGYLTSRRPDRIVSGGAEGIDTLAKTIGDEYGIPVTELKPRQRRWDGPDGFKARNEQIVRACTRLLVIRSTRSKTFGSVWTATLAERSGRPVRWHQVPAAPPPASTAPAPALADAPLPDTAPAPAPVATLAPVVADDERMHSPTEDDKGLTKLLGPKCKHCGWRTGTTDEPRPHRPAIGTEPACPHANDPAPVA